MNKDFPKLLKISLKDQLLRNGFTQRLIDELAQAATVINYGQETTVMQSFVGLVALAGIDGNLWSIKGGNKQVMYHQVTSLISILIIRIERALCQIIQLNRISNI